MQYLGKVIGVAVALLMGGGFWGVVLGLLVGHMFDRARSRRLNLFANQQERQSLFFSTTFEVMGHLTKSKGRVTEADIHVANVLMDRMNLHGESRTAAQQAVGKAAGRCTNVHHDQIGRVDVKVVERLLDLLAAAGHKCVLVAANLQFGVFVNHIACFARLLACNVNDSLHNRSLCTLSRGAKTLFKQQYVQSLLSQRCSPSHSDFS